MDDTKTTYACRNFETDELAYITRDFI